MAQIYDFIDLQNAILMADRRSTKVRKEIHNQIAKLMRLGNSIKKSGGLRFMGGVDPVITVQELKVLVAA